MHRITGLALIAGACASPAFAQASAEAPRIVVVGHGLVRTAPDLATLSFTVRGEGATSDAAARELVAKRAAIVRGLAGLSSGAPAMTTGELSIVEVRAKECDAEGNYRPRLSTGVCAIQGYVASLPATVRFSPVAGAGTALSLAGRLGATGPRVSDFGLRDPEAAGRRAKAAAVADARLTADAIARAAGTQLGALISVADQEANGPGPLREIMVTAMRKGPADAAPVAIDLNPEAIETSAALVVTYALAR